jgi:hypothetical protein
MNLSRADGRHYRAGVHDRNDRCKSLVELRAYTVRVYPRITHDNGIALSSAYRV